MSFQHPVSHSGAEGEFLGLHEVLFEVNPQGYSFTSFKLFLSPLFIVTLSVYIKIYISTYITTYIKIEEDAKLN